MFDWETFGWSIVFAGVFIVAPVWVCWRKRHEWQLDFGAAIGLVILDDDLVNLIRRRVHAACGVVRLRGKSRENAEATLAIAADKAVRRVFQERNPKGDYRRYRPRSWATISEGEAIVSLWIGHDFAQSDGIEPVRIPCDWQPDARPQIRAAIEGKGRDQRPATGAKASSPMEMLNGARRRAGR